MRKPFPALLLALLCLSFHALAQERHNSLAIDERLSDEAGPYYFVSFGDSSNAYARAAPLAEAMGVDLSYEGATKTLVFTGNGVSARLQATSDVRRGLEKRSGVLSANGADIASPMAIIVDGVSYVPIVPIAKAFGCDYAWHAQYRLITVNMPERQQVTSPESVPPTGSTANVSRAPDEVILPGFRIGVHDDFTRVAVDLGAVDAYSIAVRNDTMVVTFAANSSAEKREERDDDYLRSVYYSRVGGQPALVVRTRHPMTASGSGFRVGRTEANTLYIDFAPQFSSEAVAQLITDPVPEPTALTPGVSEGGDRLPEPAVLAPLQPTAARPVVVLDAGHGGKFPGARGSAHVREEEIVLQVTLAAKALLEARGVEVILTRDQDIHLANDRTSDLAARAAYAAPERNLFVSIHANAAENRGAHGIETYVFGEPLDQQSVQRAIEENGGENRELGIALTNESIRIASETSGRILRETQLNYSRRLAHSVQQSLVRATGAVDRGVKQNAYYVIRNARTPAILVELGFVSNPEEGSKLATEAYQALLARALVDGILDFLDTGGTLASH